jgi:hypothetical protein
MQLRGLTILSRSLSVLWVFTRRRPMVDAGIGPMFGTCITPGTSCVLTSKQGATFCQQLFINLGRHKQMVRLKCLQHSEEGYWLSGELVWIVELRNAELHSADGMLRLPRESASQSTYTVI